MKKMMKGDVQYSEKLHEQYNNDLPFLRERAKI